MDRMNGPHNLGSIRFLSGPLAGTTFPISKPVTTIGREPGNDIVVSDPSVSRHHAQITWDNGNWTISKLNPQNTLFVNQRDVLRANINERDTIGMGGTTFLFLPQGGIHGESMPVERVAQVGFNMPAQFPPQVPQAPQAQPFVIPGTTPPPPPPPAGFGGDPGGTQIAPAGISPLLTQAAPNNAQSLEISSNIHHDRQAYMLNKQVVNIGRDPSNDIVINEPVVSSFHAQIVREGNKFVLVHPHPSRQKTLNGLLYQGQHILGEQQFRKPLERGDIFRIGDEHGTLVTLTYNDGSGAAQEVVPEIRPIPLGAPVITLGRLPDNMVVLNHPQVSGHHARLEQVQGGYRIVDQHSTNHVYINGKRVGSETLKQGDEVRIGPFKLTFTGTQLTQHYEGNSIRIDALHLKKEGNKHVILIDDISIVIPPRKFVAVVGGSGAGKSTLMDALNGLRPAQEGAVLYNGQDYYKNLAAFSTQLGYVPQDDIIHRDLTVERALYYAAKLRLPNDFTEKQIQQRIEEVLEDVDMKPRRSLLVSKLSGGQRKRVSIALELLADPSIFFLDEPTSGLDPGLDRKMMFLLRKLADKGRTIVLVTHATNNINTCDYICFLCQGGRLAYFGPPDGAKKFFGKTDFAEIYSALEPTDDNPNIPAEAEAAFKRSPDYQRYVVQSLQQGPVGGANIQQVTAEVRPPKRGNPWQQFMLLSMRYLELLKNDTGNLLILLLQAPIIGLILFFLAGSGTFGTSSIATCPVRPGATSGPISCGRIVNFLKTPQGQQVAQAQYPGVPLAQAQNDYLNSAIEVGSGGDAQKIIFIMSFAAVMFGCINSAREIVKEAPIYRRERTVNLGIVPYMFSKIVVLGILCLLQSAVLVIFVQIKSPFQWSVFLPAPIEIYISMALTSLAGLMLGLAISAIAPNNDRAMSFIPIILIPQVIFSGIIFALDNPGLQFLGSFFAARWSMAAMGSTIGLHGDKLGSGSDFAYRGTLFTTVNGSTQGTAIAHLLLMWFALALMIVLLGLATAYFLKRKDVRA
ncbi:MAG TPA: FHA domain-containing protein [Ktedonobacteraceae bacterium]|nr:FHA domain-containing protein [Ktedonobacteraceae bacterium]